MRKRRMRRLFRRGIALGLGLAALVCLSRSLGQAGWEAGLQVLERPETARGLLLAELGWQAPEEEDARPLEGWGRLLLGQSPLLAAREETVGALREAREREEAAMPETEPEAREDAQEAPPSSPEPSEDPGPLPEREVTPYPTPAGTHALSIDNRTSLGVDLDALEAQELQLPQGKGPKILIYHTHGSEAYTQTEAERYTESDAYRTTDCQHNVVRVGEEMARVLREQGFEVLHDTTLYDYPVYNGSYARAREGVQKQLSEHSSLWLLLDVHRDAMVSADGSAYQFVCQQEGEESAQVMQVLGSSEGNPSHVHWQENLALAVKLQAALSERYPGLTRPITLRGTRFNQDLTTGALLVEVGGHGNTLEQALTAARLYAQALGEMLKSLESAPQR